MMPCKNIWQQLRSIDRSMEFRSTKRLLQKLALKMVRVDLYLRTPIEYPNFPAVIV